MINMNPDLRDLMNMLGSTDQGYSSGQRYAQSIAGGENIPGMIAPGVSYSAARPEGYTQADLTPAFYGGPTAPVMPSAPTQGTPFAPNEGFVQMPSAPQGVAMPERYTPMITNAESLKNLSDLFNANMPSGTQVSFDPFIDGEPMAIDDLIPSVSSSPIDFSFNPFEEIAPVVEPMVEDLPSTGSSPIDFSFNPFVDINVPEIVIPTPNPTPVDAPVDMPFRPDPIQFEPEPFFESIPYQPVTTIEDYDIPVDVIPELPVVSLQDLPTGPVDMPFIPNDSMPSISMQDYNDQLIKELLDPNSNRLPTQNFGGYNNVRSFLR
jgi:hypothetical protein